MYDFLDENNVLNNCHYGFRKNHSTEHALHDAITHVCKTLNDLNNLIDSATGNIKSAPVKHGRDLGHRIAWSSTSIIASCQHRSQLDLLEHAAISTLEPSINVQHKGPRVNACWHPLLDTIATSFVSKPANLDIGT